MKNKTLIILSSVLFGVITFVTSLFQGVLNSISASATAADSSTYVTVDELWDSSTKKMNSDNVSILLRYLTGYGGATGGAAVKAYIDNNGTEHTYTDSNSVSTTFKTVDSSVIRENVLSAGKVGNTSYAGKSSGQNVIVTLGGFTWYVTYLSTDLNGSLIATLWLSDTNQDAFNGATNIGSYDSFSTKAYKNDSTKTGYYYRSCWSSNWNSNNPKTTDTYISNLYGSSYMRAVTLNNGGTYSTSASALASATQSDNNIFKEFTMSSYGLTNYLVTPSSVPWQLKQTIVSSNDDYPNSSIETHRTDKKYVDSGHTTENVNYSGYQDYDDWENDYLWLPSMSEVGWYGANGAWKLTESERSSTLDACSWLRSGISSNTGHSYYLVASGGSDLSYVSYTHAVRPSLHLNLGSLVHWTIYDGEAVQVDELFDEVSGSVNTDNTQILLNYLTGTSESYLTNVTSYLGGTAATNVKTSANLRSNEITGGIAGETGFSSKSNGQNIVVILGGLDWYVTYLSNDNDGNQIATLWLADTQNNLFKEYYGNDYYSVTSGTNKTTSDGHQSLSSGGVLSSRWSANWYKDSPEEGDSYISNIYGSSYIRAVTLNNGGTYSTSETASSTATKNANNIFAKFTMPDSTKQDLTEFIVTPSKVSWQNYETDSSNSSVINYPNGSLNTTNNVYTTANYKDTSAKVAYNANASYTSWGSDYLWLPSLYETGSGASGTQGFWSTTVSMRDKSSSSYSWLRSGYYGTTLVSYRLNASGGYYNSSVSYSYAVRPALHLNLTLLAKRAGLDGDSVNVGELFDETTDGEGNKSGEVNVQNLSLLYQYITGISGATLKDVKNALSSSTSTNPDTSAKVLTSKDIRTIALDSGTLNGKYYGSKRGSDVANSKDDGQNIQVTLGGFTWDVVYLSTDTSGNAIATLWMSDTYQNKFNGQSQSGVSFSNGAMGGIFNSAYIADSSSTYIANIYGSSYINAVALNNGGFYSTSATAGQTYTKSNDSVFADFTVIDNSRLDITDFLVKPSSVAWQNYVTSPYDASSNNNGWNNSKSWANGSYNTSKNAYTTTGLTYNNKTYYDAWKNSYLWLPSIYETYGTNGNNALWSTTRSTRGNLTNSYSWLRSGYNGVTHYSCSLGASGGYNPDYVGGSCAVRPSLHLNLSSLALWASLEGEAVQVGELWDESSSSFNKTNLKTLFDYLTGTQNASYYKLKETISTSTSTNADTGATVLSSQDLRKIALTDSSGNVLKQGSSLKADGVTYNDDGQNIQVHLGGFTWDVVYLSYDENGDPIATLWMSDTWQEKYYDGTSSGSYSFSNGVMNSKWSNWTDNSPTTAETYKYVSNIYGSSYMRAVTLNNGGSYSKSSTLLQGETTVGDGNATVFTPDESSIFSLFTCSDDSSIDLTDFLVKPKYVSWQNYETTPYSSTNTDAWKNSKSWANNSLNLSNNAWTTKTYSNDSSTYVNYNQYGTYDDWANDYLWLPSIYETYGTNGNNALWSTTSPMRGNSTNSSSWLRSGAYDYTRNSCLLSASGGANGNYVDSSYAVRPSLHLNLKSAAVSAALTAGAVVDELWESKDDGTDDSEFNSQNLQKVFDLITGTEGTTYDQIATLATSKLNSAGMRANGIVSDKYYKPTNTDIVITLGGLTWYATYLSTDANGDVILTLWMDDTWQYEWSKIDSWSLKDGSTTRASLSNGVLSGQYNPWADNSPNSTDKYISNAYGTSYMRSVLLNNGGSYANGKNVLKGETTANDGNKIVYTPSTSSLFANFTVEKNGLYNDLTDFIVTPALVSWQKNQVVSGSKSYPNDSWDKNEGTNTTKTYNDSGNIVNYGNHTGYEDWKNDYLWIPSFQETNWSGENAGKWGTTSSMRGNSTNSYSWLRSGYNYYTVYLYGLSASGGNNDSGVSGSCAVRPSLHLNLTSAAASAALIGEADKNSDTIFLDEINGVDTNDGLTIESAVKTISRAEKLVSNGGMVYTMSTLHLTTDTIIGENKTFTLKRYVGNAQNYFNGDFIVAGVYGTGLYDDPADNIKINLTLCNVKIDGGFATTTFKQDVDTDFLIRDTASTIVISNSALIVFELGCEIFGKTYNTDDNADLGRGVSLKNDSTIVINDGHFHDNSVASAFIDDSGTEKSFSAITINGGIFDNIGGASFALLRSTNNCVTINGGEFKNQTSNNSESVIVNSPTCIINDGCFHNNLAVAYGLIYSTTAIINGGEFFANTSSSNGVVATVKTGAYLEINGGVFDGNGTGATGGVIYANSNSTINIQNATFMNNFAKNSAVMYADTGSVVNVRDCYFYKNYFNGSETIAIIGIKGTAKFNNCVFEENYYTAGYASGTINVTGSGEVRNCSFIKNTNHHYMIYGVDCYDCYFDGNAAYDGLICGRKVYDSVFENTTRGPCIRSGSAYRCEFINNKITNSTAVLYASNAYDCVFNGNYGTNNGVMYQGSAYNCEFYNNRATNGGALNGTTAYNCIIENNFASGKGSAGYATTACNCTIKNNVTASENGGAMYSTSNRNVTTAGYDAYTYIYDNYYGTLEDFFDVDEDGFITAYKGDSVSDKVQSNVYFDNATSMLVLTFADDDIRKGSKIGISSSYAISGETLVAQVTGTDKVFSQTVLSAFSWDNDTDGNYVFFIKDVTDADGNKTGSGVWVKIAPYTIVEYVDIVNNSASGYRNGITLPVKNWYKFVVEVQPLTFAGSGNMIIGTGTASSSNSPWAAINSNGTTQNSSVTISPNTYDKTKKSQLSFSSTGWVDSNVFIGGWNGETAWCATNRIYLIKGYDSCNNLLIDLVPVYNIITDEYGLFDLVSQTFFGNQGTGDFSGPVGNLFTASDNYCDYDGGAHGIIVTAKNLSKDDYTVYYSTEKDGTYSTTPIKITEPGTQKVWYYIKLGSKTTAKDYRTIKISKLNLTATASKCSIKVKKGDVLTQNVEHTGDAITNFFVGNVVDEFNNAVSFDVYLRSATKTIALSDNGVTVEIDIVPKNTERYNTLKLTGITLSVSYDELYYINGGFYPTDEEVASFKVLSTEFETVLPLLTDNADIYFVDGFTVSANLTLASSKNITMHAVSSAIFDVQAGKTLVLGSFASKGQITLTGDDYSILSALIKNAGTLRIYNSILQSVVNASDELSGGGISSTGAVEIYSSTLQNLRTYLSGGGVCSTGTLIIKNSLVTGCMAKVYGGGICSSGPTCNIYSSQIVSNYGWSDGTSTPCGAGIYVGGSNASSHIMNSNVDNNGIGKFVENSNGWTPTNNLPSEYQEVEYIESTGTQWIDSGVYVTKGYYAIIDFLETANVGDGSIFGTYHQGIIDYRAGGSISFGFTYNTPYPHLQRTIATGSKVDVNDSLYKFYIFAKMRQNNLDCDSRTKARLFSLKIYNSSDLLVRKFIPCVRNSDNKPGLYDTVSGTFFTNAATSGADFSGPGFSTSITPTAGMNGGGMFVADGANVTTNNSTFNNNKAYQGAGVYVGGSEYTLVGDDVANLSSEYQQVEYIESTGTQWIDTGISAPGGFLVNIKYYLNSASTQFILGVDGNRNYFKITGTKSCELGVGSCPSFNVNSVFYGDVIDIEVSTLINNCYLILDNKKYTVSGTSSRSGSSIYLFKLNGNNNYPMIGKIYSLKMFTTDLNNPVANYIPCYRKSDNKPGLYDTVSGTFFTNQATSGADFSSGPAVYGEVEYSKHTQVTFDTTDISSNTSVKEGAGIYVGDRSTATFLSGNITKNAGTHVVYSIGDFNFGNINSKNATISRNTATTSAITSWNANIYGGVIRNNTSDVIKITANGNILGGTLNVVDYSACMGNVNLYPSASITTLTSKYATDPFLTYCGDYVGFTTRTFNVSGKTAGTIVCALSDDATEEDAKIVYGKISLSNLTSGLYKVYGQIDGRWCVYLSSTAMTAATTKTYYFDPAGTKNGNDTNNGTASTTPFRTWEKVLKVAKSGDTVYILSTWTISDSCTIDGKGIVLKRDSSFTATMININGGTEGNEIDVKLNNFNIDGNSVSGITVSTSKYTIVIINNFKMTAISGTGFYSNGKLKLIDVNCNIVGNSAGISSMNYVSILDCYFYQTYSIASGCRILNVSGRVGDDSLKVNISNSIFAAGGRSDASLMRIQTNVDVNILNSSFNGSFHPGGDTVINFVDCNEVYIENCKIFDNNSSSNAICDSIKISGQNTVVMLKNICFFNEHNNGSRNMSNFKGIVYINVGGNVTVEDCQFVSNVGGFAIEEVDSNTNEEFTVNLKNLIFNGNTVNSDGGVLNIKTKTGTGVVNLENVKSYLNTGAKIHVKFDIAGTLNATDLSIFDNVCTGTNLVYLTSAVNSTVNINNLQVLRNTLTCPSDVLTNSMTYFKIASNSTLNLTDCVFEDNQSTRESSYNRDILYVESSSKSGSKVNVFGGKVTGNVSNGSAVLGFNNLGNLKIDNFEAYSNWARNTLLYIGSTNNEELNNCIFNENDCCEGYEICSFDAKKVINNCVFKNNRGKAIIYFPSGTACITNSSFVSNNRVILSYNQSQITIDNCLFDANESAVEITNCQNVLIANSIFVNANNSSLFISLGATDNAKISKCLFQDSSLRSITITLSYVIIDDCCFENNKWAIYASNSSASIYNSTFVNCDIAISSSKTTNSHQILIDGCRFENNSSESYLINLVDAHVEINDSTFRNNKLMGGLVRLVKTDSLFVTFDSDKLDISGNEFMKENVKLIDVSGLDSVFFTNLSVAGNYSEFAGTSLLNATNTLEAYVRHASVYGNKFVGDSSIITINGGYIDFNSCDFFSNIHAGENGKGGVFRITNANVIFNNCCFNNNVAHNGSDLYVGEGANVSLFNCTIHNHNDESSFETNGLVFVDSYGNVEFVRGIITNNFLTNAYGLIFNNGSIAFAGMEISNNKTNSGMIYNDEDGVFGFDGNVLITDNEAVNGGAIYNKGIVNFTSATLSNNTAVNGGAIYNDGSLAMTSGNITGNVAMNGGGIYNNNNFTMNGGSIAENEFTVAGGGVFNSSVATFNFNDGFIQENAVDSSVVSSVTYGGGVANFGTLNMVGGTIKENGGIGASYEVLEYIESTGQQKIDSNFIPSSLTKMEFIASRSSDYMYVNTPGSYRYGVELYSAPYLLYGSGYDRSGSTSKDTKHKYIIDSGVLTVYTMSDTLCAKIDRSTNSAFVCTNTLRIFSSGSGRIYYLKLYKDGVNLSRNYIPVRNVLTGEVGLYDKVEGKFYGNSGTGEFVAGPTTNTYVDILTNTLGGGVYVGGSSTTNLLGGSIVDNVNSSNGANVYLENGSTTNIDGLVLGRTETGEVISNDGYGIYGNNAKLYMKNSLVTLSNNDEENVKVVCLEDCDSVIENCTFENCVCSDEGSVIYATGGKIDLSGTTFESNTTEVGSVVLDQVPIVKIDDCKFLSNTTTGENGGALTLVTDNSNVKILNSTFDANAGVNGGAIHFVSQTNGDVYQSGNVFTNNTASNNGGAIFVEPSINVEIDGDTIGLEDNGNSATNNGGGIYVDLANLTLSGTTSIQHNSASSNGGGVFADFTGYEELEYIEGTGTQWIDTGYSPNDDTAVVTTFSLLSGEHMVAANVQGDGWPGRFFVASDSLNGVGLRFVIGNEAIYSKYTRGTKVSVRFNINKKVYVNDVLIGELTGQLNRQTSNNVLVFKTSGYGNATQPALGKMYRLSICEFENIVRDFVPVRHMKTGEVGLYDKVEGKFYGNSGTGEFVAGNPTGNYVGGQPTKLVISSGSQIQIKNNTNNVGASNLYLTKDMDKNILEPGLLEGSDIRISLGGTGNKGQDIIGSSNGQAITSRDLSSIKFDNSNLKFVINSSTNKLKLVSNGVNEGSWGVVVGDKVETIDGEYHFVDENDIQVYNGSELLDKTRYQIFYGLKKTDDEDEEIEYSEKYVKKNLKGTYQIAIKVVIPENERTITKVVNLVVKGKYLAVVNKPTVKINSGEALSLASILGGKVVTSDGKVVSGTWSFDEKTLVPSNTLQKYLATFTPYNKSIYENELKAELNIQISYNNVYFKDNKFYMDDKFTLDTGLTQLSQVATYLKDGGFVYFASAYSCLISENVVTNNKIYLIPMDSLSGCMFSVRASAYNVLFNFGGGVGQFVIDGLFKERALVVFKLDVSNDMSAVLNVGENVTIKNFVNNDGKASVIQNNGGKVCLNGCTIHNCSSSSSTGDALGGAMFNAGELYINSGDFRFNNSTSSAENSFGFGGVCYNEGKLIVSGGFFTKNTAGKGGCFASVQNDGSEARIILNNGSILINSAVYGGAIYLKNAKLDMNGGNIYVNSAEFGGGIFNEDNSSDIVLNGGELKFNTVSSSALNIQSQEDDSVASSRFILPFACFVACLSGIILFLKFKKKKLKNN